MHKNHVLMPVAPCRRLRERLGSAVEGKLAPARAGVLRCFALFLAYITMFSGNSALTIPPLMWSAMLAHCASKLRTRMECCTAAVLIKHAGKGGDLGVQAS